MLTSCQRRVYLYGAISVHNSLADLRQDGAAATGASNRCLYNGSAKTLIEIINEVPGLPIRQFQRGPAAEIEPVRAICSSTAILPGPILPPDGRSILMLSRSPALAASENLRGRFGRTAQQTAPKVY
jgi:hypothetical protein